MSEEQDLSLVIERIYDASLDASRWTPALEHICAWLGGCTANIFYQNNADHSVSLFHAWGEDPAFTALYVEKYAGLNPLFPTSSFLEIGKVHALGEVIPLDEFCRTRLYLEWVQPQKILDVLYCNLERLASGAAAIAVRRREADGLFGDSEKSRLQLIIPHLRRAIAIGNVVDFHKGHAAALSRTLDGLTAAVVLADADSRITFANSEAESMLKAGTILKSTGGQLTAAKPEVNAELRDAISSASRGDAALGHKGSAIALAVNGEKSHIAHVLSLTSGERGNATNGNATAAVFVRAMAPAVKTSLEIMARTYDLTSSELRVLAAVLDNGNIRHVSEFLGIGEATVKTHLNHLFAKTATQRQRDLVALAARFESPFTQ